MCECIHLLLHIDILNLMDLKEKSTSHLGKSSYPKLIWSVEVSPCALPFWFDYDFKDLAKVGLFRLISNTKINIVSEVYPYAAPYLIFHGCKGLFKGVWLTSNIF